MCGVNVVEFQNALQIARAIKGVEHTLEQHVIINHISKHKKALACANTTLPFVILTCKIYIIYLKYIFNIRIYALAYMLF